MTTYWSSCEEIPVSLNSTKSPEEPASRSYQFVLMQHFRLFCRKMGKKTSFHKNKQTKTLPLLLRSSETSLPPFFRCAYPRSWRRLRRWLSDSAGLYLGVGRRGYKRTTTHAADAHRPLLWLSRPHTPPPGPLPTLPCDCSMSFLKLWQRANTKSTSQICSLTETD